MRAWPWVLWPCGVGAFAPVHPSRRHIARLTLDARRNADAYDAYGPPSGNREAQAGPRGDGSAEGAFPEDWSRDGYDPRDGGNRGTEAYDYDGYDEYAAYDDYGSPAPDGFEEPRVVGGFRTGDGRTNALDGFLKAVYDSLFFGGMELEEDYYRGMDFSEIMENLQIEMAERRRRRRGMPPPAGSPGVRYEVPRPNMEDRGLFGRFFENQRPPPPRNGVMYYDDEEPLDDYDYESSPETGVGPPSRARRTRGPQYTRDGQVVEMQQDPEDWSARWRGPGAPAPSAPPMSPQPPESAPSDVSGPPQGPVESRAPRLDPDVLVRRGLVRQLETVTEELDAKSVSLEVCRKRDGQEDRVAELEEDVAALVEEKAELEAELKALG